MNEINNAEISGEGGTMTIQAVLEHTFMFSLGYILAVLILLKLNTQIMAEHLVVALLAPICILFSLLFLFFQPYHHKPSGAPFIDMYTVIYILWQTHKKWVFVGFVLPVLLCVDVFFPPRGHDQ